MRSLSQPPLVDVPQHWSQYERGHCCCCLSFTCKQWEKRNDDVYLTSQRRRQEPLSPQLTLQHAHQPSVTWPTSTHCDLGVRIHCTTRTHTDILRNHHHRHHLHTSSVRKQAFWLARSASTEKSSERKISGFSGALPGTPQFGNWTRPTAAAAVYFPTPLSTLFRRKTTAEEALRKSRDAAMARNWETSNDL